MQGNRIRTASSVSAVEEQGAPARSAARLGVVYGVSSYIWWGLCPVYFKIVADVPPLQVLCHRVVWSLAFLVILLVCRKHWGDVRKNFRDRRTLVRLVITSALIANNWGIFIWTVSNDRLLEASFGYFIGPLVSVMLGCVFLKERLRRMQVLCVLLAVVGVGYLIFVYGSVPWVALVLAFSFGFYGLLRKTMRAEALTGLTIETALLAPLALAFLIFEDYRGVGAFARISWQMDGLLASAGVVTAVPLLWFAAAARRMRLSTLGFLQYLAPTGQFLLAVLAFHEPFTREHLISFTCIWIALLLYSTDAALVSRRSARSARSPCRT